MLTWRRRDPSTEVIGVPALGQFRVVAKVVSGDGATTCAVQSIQVVNDWHGPVKARVVSKAQDPHEFKLKSFGELLDSNKTWSVPAKLQGDVHGVEHTAELNPETVRHGMVEVKVHVETRSKTKRKYSPDSVMVNW